MRPSSIPPGRRLTQARLKVRALAVSLLLAATLALATLTMGAATDSTISAPPDGLTAGITTVTTRLVSRA